MTKKKNKSKAHGKSFEREICKMLSLHLTEEEREDIFWPSHNSGGRFTMRKKSDKDTAYQGGDLSFSDPLGEPLIKAVNFELKTGYGTKRKTDKGTVKTNWCILDLIDSSQKEPIFMEFWNQCSRDAKESGREPILIFRRNNKKACICIKKKLFIFLKEMYGETNFITIDINSLIIMNLMDFLYWVDDLESIIGGCENHGKKEGKTKCKLSCSTKAGRKV